MERSRPQRGGASFFWFFRVLTAAAQVSGAAGVAPPTMPGASTVSVAATTFTSLA